GDQHTLETSTTAFQLAIAENRKPAFTAALQPQQAQLANQALARTLTAVARSSGGRVKASRSHGERSADTERSRPGTTATPRRSAAWVNPPESASPGRRAQTVRPPAGGGPGQTG